MRHLRASIVVALVVALVALSATVALAATKSVGVKKTGSKYSLSAMLKSVDTVSGLQLIMIDS